LEILEKHDGEFPAMIPEQKIYEALKIIGEKAELDDEMVLLRMKGGSLNKRHLRSASP